MHASVLVLQYGELVDLAEALEHMSDITLLEIARNLPHEELDSVLI